MSFLLHLFLLLLMLMDYCGLTAEPFLEEMAASLISLAFWTSCDWWFIASLKCYNVYFVSFSCRELSREREFGREVGSGGDASSMKSKPHSLSGDPHHRHRTQRASPGCSSHNIEAPVPRPSKRKSEHHHHDRDSDRHEQGRHHRPHHRSESSTKPLPETKDKPISTTAADSDRKYKPSVFSRISFEEGEATSKKRKLSSSTEPAVAAAADGPSTSSSRHKSSSSAANGFYDDHQSSAKVASLAYGRKSASASAMDYESSDDDRHFKRKPSRYEPSPPRPADREGGLKHSRASRERDRKQR